MTTFSNGDAISSTRMVVDAGLVFRSLMPIPEQMYIQQLITQRRESGIDLYAPSLWRYELTSSITKARHFGQLTTVEAEKALTDTMRFAIRLIEPDEALVQSAFEWTVKLQRAAAYDSFYLALAQQLQCEFWTADKRLFNAANVAWVKYVGDTT